MDLFFLQAKVPLVKQYQRVGDAIQVLPYPLVNRFTSNTASIATLTGFLLILQANSLNKAFLLKGTLEAPLINESRAGKASNSALTEWALLDIDGIPGLSVEDVMTKLDLGDVSYIVQYSASMGVLPNKGLSCHVFVLLDSPVHPTLLKNWLIRKNLTCFPEHITLNRLNESLHWPLDITTCQNDKLIYIAPPICFPPELDQFSGERIVLVQKAQDHFVFPKEPISTPTKEIESLKLGLRQQKGLPKSVKPRLDKATQTSYSPNPETAVVTGIRVADEFTHLNLNGGNSWGYYHSTKRPEFIYNFKGEPNYKTSELLPDYWEELQKVKHAEKTKNTVPSRTLLAFRDFPTDTYYNGWFDKSTNELVLHEAKTKDRLNDFLTSFGLAALDPVPDWTCSYEPTNLQRIDIPTLRVNWFQPSPYMLQPKPDPGAPHSFPAIRCLIQNVIGGDPRLVSHFLHWTACAFVLRLPNGTAWILQGVPGTGKGMLVNEVLRPLFGASNTAIKRMSELSDKFNEYIENTLICFIDEISIGEDRDHDKIMADLKQQITEPMISIRKMRAAAREVPNYTNWIFSTNNKQPIKLEEGDRRYNIGDFCEVMLKDRVDTYAFVEQIQQELPHFANFLVSMTLDRTRAASVIYNEARQYMIDSSMTTADMLAKVINTGDLAALYGFVEDHPDGADPIRKGMAEAYANLLKDLVLTLRTNLSREELAVIFDNAIGVRSAPRGAAKFTQYLGHHDIRIKPVRINGELKKGVQVQWSYDPIWLAETQAALGNAKLKLVPLQRIAK